MFATKVCFWYVYDVYNGYINFCKWVSTNYYVSITSLKIEKESQYLCDNFYIEWCCLFKKGFSQWLDLQARTCASEFQT